MKIRSLGLLAALVAALALLFGAAPAAAGGGSAWLLWKHKPILVFDGLEAFRPTTVESFVADADLERLTGPNTWTLVDPAPTPAGLPGPGTGIWRLNHDGCSPVAGLAAVACYDAADDGDPTLYGRVLRTGDRIVLQYWLFYVDNFYSYAYPPSDFIWQAHEGDWEVVNVVLSEHKRPLSTAYSQHCLGESRSWRDTKRVLGHPIVHVAIGSHANYYERGLHPFDPRCIPAEALAFFQQAGLPLPVDYASVRPVLGKPSRIVRLGETEPSWLLFPGFWGELQYFHAPPPVGTVPFGTAPVGPAYHAVWIDPLGTIATWSPGP